MLGGWFGGTSGWPYCDEEAGGANGCESEAHDRTAIELPGRQAELAAALKVATAPAGAPLVCVLVHGGAVALGEALGACDAIVDLWVPGQMGGAALADVLFGAVSPAGRAPYTFYAATSDLPPMGYDFNEDATPERGSNGTTYRYYRGNPPAFRFGDGLSYTTFRYSSLAAPSAASPCDDVTLSVVVTNAGEVASDEVVQVYAATPNASVPAPRTRLVAFARARDIAPGEARTVTLTVRPASHAVVHPRADVYAEPRAIEAGPLVLSVGGAQPTGAADDPTVSATVDIDATAELATCA